MTESDTIGDVEVEALLYTLAKALVEAKFNTLGDILGNVDCEALVDILADTLAKVDNDPYRYTQRQAHPKAVINMLVVALEQVKNKHLAAHCLMWRPRQIFGDSLRDVQAHVLADTTPDTLAEAKA